MSKVRLDAVIHPPNRLRICALLSPLEEAEFQVLREELDVSDSVLSKHLSQLEQAGYLSLRKGVVDGRRRTWARLTASGRKAFARHVAALKEITAMASNGKQS